MFLIIIQGYKLQSRDRRYPGLKKKKKEINITKAAAGVSDSSPHLAIWRDGPAWCDPGLTHAADWHVTALQPYKATQSCP